MVVGLGNGLAVPARAFVPTAVLIYSDASIVTPNVPSLSSLLSQFTTGEKVCLKFRRA